MTPAELLQKLADSIGVAPEHIRGNPRIYQTDLAKSGLKPDDLTPLTVAAAESLDRQLWRAILARVDSYNAAWRRWKFGVSAVPRSDNVFDTGFQDPKPKEFFRMLKVTKKEIVDLFLALGYSSAADWSDKRIDDHIAKLPAELEDEDDEPDLNAAQTKLLKKIVKEVEAEGEVDVDPGKGKKTTKAKATKGKKPAASDDDDESDDDDDDGDDDDSDDDDSESDDDDDAEEDDDDSADDDDDEDSDSDEDEDGEDSDSDDDDEDADSDDDDGDDDDSDSDDDDDSDADDEPEPAPKARKGGKTLDDVCALLTLILGALGGALGKSDKVPVPKSAKGKPVKPAKGAKAPKGKKPKGGNKLSDVIDAIRELFVAADSSKKAIKISAAVQALEKQFPDRETEWLKDKVKTQLGGRLVKRDGLDLKKTADGKYWVKPAG